MTDVMGTEDGLITLGMKLKNEVRTGIVAISIALSCFYMLQSAILFDLHIGIIFKLRVLKWRLN